MDSTIHIYFIESVRNVLMTMLSLDARICFTTKDLGDEPREGITGVINMTGDVEGTVAVNFPTRTASKLASRLFSDEIDEASEDINDAVGELTNMICGNAKSKFKDRRASIDCPTVHRGKWSGTNPRGRGQTSTLAASTDCGTFSIEISLIDHKTNQDTVTDAA